ncbi:hypothetical protein MBM_01348 [Drepanopeziza brunnea f. sp. 'multigermtubi' MB_m1]|uniref:Uncharacterized protein n=1 Tax=Marssonina brunnea f. sp. multigermtubi (strain MB_m1) TaxID=1072389 RepID=K1X6G0_MARBU|nr:uncharacterized protein MBM_01348 [Drepanopeziza brunnea f. sp. 'multigermtubi' MB_m1]EKD20666.1 hypothetical protein MBM_01348 [Drepanopeziza brunnea f. sp. 'multigermtubi' MB_m1]
MHIPDAELEAQISSSCTQDQADQREREEAVSPATTAVHIPQRTYHHPTVASETESASVETRAGSTRHSSPRPYSAPGISRIQSASPSGHSRSPPRGRSRVRDSSPGPSLPLRSSVASIIRGACICGHCRAAIHSRSTSPFRDHSVLSDCTGPRRSMLGNAVENVPDGFGNFYQDRSQNISYGYCWYTGV